MSTKRYEKSVFQKLEFERQLDIMLLWIRAVESSERENRIFSSDEIRVLTDYLSWVHRDTRHESLRVESLLTLIGSEPTLKKLGDVATALERALSKTVKDHQFLISSDDSDQSKGSPRPLFLVLDNLRSAFNVGGIFRTAEGLGVSHIYLVGFTPTPEDVSVQKTAMGADAFVSWSAHSEVKSVLIELKERGVTLVALETAENTPSIFEYSWKEPSALFVGNERFGLESPLLGEMDAVVNIPMRGRKNSLNVATAMGMTLSEMGRQLDSSVREDQ